MTESLYFGAIAAAALIALSMALILSSGRVRPAETWIAEISRRDAVNDRLEYQSGRAAREEVAGTVASARAGDGIASRATGHNGKFEQRVPIRQ